MPPTRVYGDLVLANPAGDFRRGAGRTYASQGNYDRATQIDPDRADTYGAMQDRTEQRTYGRRMARALNSNDFAQAGNVAAEFGNVEGVQTAQTVAQQFQDRRSRERLRDADQWASELEMVAQTPDPNAQQQTYTQARAAWLNVIRQRGEDTSEFERLFPAQFSPNIAGRARHMVDTALNATLTAEQIAEMRSTQATNAHRQAQLDETIRHNQATEARLLRPGGGGAGRASFRPITPQEAQSYGLPNNGAGYAMGSNGRPVRVSGGSGNAPVLAGAEQRGRIALSFSNIVQAQEDLGRLEGGARAQRTTPFGRDWGARLAEAVPFDGGSAARVLGGSDYQAYETAARTFEQSMMPIFSGSAVTESEAQRFVRANLPRFGDSPQTLQAKSRNRARMINAAATILGADPPYPDAGIWTPSGGLTVPHELRFDNAPTASEVDGGGYDPNDPNTWTSEQRQRWLEENQ